MSAGTAKARTASAVVRHQKMLAKIESGLKRCPRCQTTRSRDEFYLDATQPDGLRGYCKPCLVEKNAEYREHCRALKQKLGC